MNNSIKEHYEVLVPHMTDVLSQFSYVWCDDALPFFLRGWDCTRFADKLEVLPGLVQAGMIPFEALNSRLDYDNFLEKMLLSNVLYDHPSGFTFEQRADLLEGMGRPWYAAILRDLNILSKSRWPYRKFRSMSYAESGFKLRHPQCPERILDRIVSRSRPNPKDIADVLKNPAVSVNVFQKALRHVSLSLFDTGVDKVREPLNYGHMGFDTEHQLCSTILSNAACSEDLFIRASEYISSETDPTARKELLNIILSNPNCPIDVFKRNVNEYLQIIHKLPYEERESPDMLLAHRGMSEEAFRKYFQPGWRRNPEGEPVRMLSSVEDLDDEKIYTLIFYGTTDTNRAAVHQLAVLHPQCSEYTLKALCRIGRSDTAAYAKYRLFAQKFPELTETSDTRNATLNLILSDDSLTEEDIATFLHAI